MTAPVQKLFGVGLNAARYYALTAAGYPAATNTTAYAGVNIGGPISYEITLPSYTKIAHIGNNAILQQDQLPGTESSTGILRVSRYDSATVAALSGVKVETVGHTHMTPVKTSQQGLEPTVGLMVYQQAKDNAGNRRWITYVLPKCVITPSLKSMSREVGDIPYDITPMISTKTIAGTTLTATDNGCTSAEVNVYESNYRKAIVSWVGNNTAVDFDFPAALQCVAASANNCAVYVNGVFQSSGVTYDTDDIVFAVAPATGAVIVAIYDIPDTAIDTD